MFVHIISDLEHLIFLPPPSGITGMNYHIVPIIYTTRKLRCPLVLGFPHPGLQKVLTFYYPCYFPQYTALSHLLLYPSSTYPSDCHLLHILSFLCAVDEHVPWSMCEDWRMAYVRELVLPFRRTGSGIELRSSGLVASSSIH